MRCLRLILLALPAILQGSEVPEAGRLPGSWVPGSVNCIEQPEWAIHEYNPDFYILRESGCLNYEKPFLYLIFGSTRALLLDTGAGREPKTAAAVSSLLSKRARLRNMPVPELLVLHSHGHGDHVSGDAELARLPNTRVIPAKPEAIASEFRIAKWPSGIATLDLGDRVLDLLPIPGHEAASIALYDRRTGVLLTGDTLYPGRLYVRDWAAYRDSISRLAVFAESRPVAHILGAHIEQMRTPFRDYLTGTTYQPEEHCLELPLGTLLELDSALRAAGETPVKITRRDFTVVPRQPATPSR